MGFGKKLKGLLTKAIPRPGGDVGELPGDVPGHVGRRPSVAARWCSPLLRLDRAQELAETSELIGESSNDFLARQRHD